MESEDWRYLARGLQQWRGSRILCAAAVAAILMVSEPPVSYSYSLYSGSSVGANGTVYGWAVTDGTPPPGFQMTHTAYVRTWLTSPNGRSAYSGSLSGSNWRRGDVLLAFDPDDMGTYYVSTDHGVYCAVWGWIIALWVAHSNSQKSLVPPSLNCGTQTRGQSATCTVTDQTGIWNVSNWRYIDGTTGAQTVSEPSRTAKTWSGVVVRSGTVKVTASGPDTRTLTWSLAVNNRAGWAFTAVSAGKVANGSGTGPCTGLLPILTTPTSEASNFGFNCLNQEASYVTSQVSGGPNHGYKYNTSASNSFEGRPTLFQWERVPDLDNAGSTFYLMQTGTYNAQSNPTGCISGTNLASQTQRHEAGPVQGHWGFYKGAQDNTSNNLGSAIEPATGLPSDSVEQFQNALNTTLGNKRTTIRNAAGVEPFEVNRDQSGVFLGNVNFAPAYTTCQ